MPLPRKSKRDKFVAAVWSQYHAAGRHDLPWRKTRSPYRILVSEIMLQQTQAERVRGFFDSFTRQFPSAAALAAAPAADVIRAWQGLGYNRRALALQRAAREIVRAHRGRVPRAREALLALPGVGPYTAGAVRVFAWNEPGELLETNVRAVYIHFFFPGKERVPDADLAPLIAATADRENPREWWWAIMDYGAHLKATHGNVTRRSAAYVRAKKFAGSDRELRGKILALVAAKPRALREIQGALGGERDRLRGLVAALRREGFVTYNGRRYELAR